MIVKEQKQHDQIQRLRKRQKLHARADPRAVALRRKWHHKKRQAKETA